MDTENKVHATRHSAGNTAAEQAAAMGRAAVLEC